MKSKKTRISEEIVHKNPYWSVSHDIVKIPNGEEAEYFRVVKPDGCIILIENDSRELLLINQYRYPSEKYYWEFPAGSVMENKTPSESAVVEIMEETGLKVEKIELIGTYNPLNGLLGNTSYVFLAKDFVEMTQTDKDNLEHDFSAKYEEIVEKSFMSIDTIDKLVRDGEFDDSLSLAALAIYKAHNEK